MAAVDILKSPLQLDAMPPKQRAPLSNLPHALNSPLRGTTSKRTRAEGKSLFDDVSAPPSKRQHLDQEIVQQDRENVPPNPVTPPRRRAVATLDSRLGHGGRSEAIDRERIRRQQLLIAKEKEKAREREYQREKAQREQRAQRDAQEEKALKWLRFYDKHFPTFVFYFDSVPEDARRKCSRQIRELGAQEDRFFSRAITHVITARSIPSEAATPVEEEHADTHHGGTIDPSLLDKRNRTMDELASNARGRSIFDVALSKKAGLHKSPEKGAATKIDVLQKAMDLGIKIWPLEKLQRVIKALFDGEYEVEYVDREQQHLTRAPKKQPDTLTKLIQREEQSKNPVYDHHALLKTELIPLHEPYIYVRCMNEKTKPLMVRQYAKVTKSTDGEWPQFRPVTQGKCPFIIEETKSRRNEKEQKREKVEKQEPRVTRDQAGDEVHQKESRVAGAKSHYFDEDDHLNPDVAARQARDKYKSYEHPFRFEKGKQARKEARYEAARAAERDQTSTIEDEDSESEEIDEEATEDDPEMQNEESTMRPDEDATTDAAQVTPTQSDFSRVGHEHVQHSRQTSFDMMAPPTALPRPNTAVGRPGGEPTASGLQRSGATATIRSTMGISSAAAQPGLKAGTSRDVQSLQRRVLDRYSTGSGSALGTSEKIASSAQMGHTGNSGLIESRRMADIAGRARAENPRAAKTRAQEKLHIQHHTMAAQDQERALAKIAQKKEMERQAKAKREPKPGYCENCKDKFDDFDEHIQSRKHRKFATTKDNWTELDALLQQLERPAKRKHSSDDDTISMSSQRYSDDIEVVEVGERASKRSRMY